LFSLLANVVGYFTCKCGVFFFVVVVVVFIPSPPPLNSGLWWRKLIS